MPQMRLHWTMRLCACVHASVCVCVCVSVRACVYLHIITVQSPCFILLLAPKLLRSTGDSSLRLASSSCSGKDVHTCVCVCVCVCVSICAFDNMYVQMCVCVCVCVCVRERKRGVWRA